MEFESTSSNNLKEITEDILSEENKENLKELAQELYKILGHKYIDFDVQLGDLHIVFTKPTTKEEEIIFNQNREMMVKELLKPENIHRVNYFISVNEQAKAIVASNVDKAIYEVAQRHAHEYIPDKDCLELEKELEVSSRAVNLESIYVNMQREDWNEEKQIKLIMEKDGDWEDANGPYLS